MTNAIQFIKDNGVDKAREVVEGAPEWATVYDTEVNDYYRSSITTNKDVNLSELKRLVESVDFIKKIGGFVAAKSFWAKGSFKNCYKEKLEQAIADYEQLFGNTETLGGEHV